MSTELDSIVRGERAFEEFKDVLRLILGDGDELYRVVTPLIREGDDPALKSFLRQLQKRLERLERLERA